jgi:hypothetical protein
MDGVFNSVSLEKNSLLSDHYSKALNICSTLNLYQLNKAKLHLSREIFFSYTFLKLKLQRAVIIRSAVQVTETASFLSHFANP